MLRSGESHGDPDLSSADGEVARSPVWPMIPGVVAAAFALEFVCSWLRRGMLPRIGLILLASSLLFVSVMVCGFVVRAIYARAVPGSRRVATPVVRAACLTALWIPAWVLYVETWSLLMLVAGCLCLASLGIFLKRCDVDAAAPALTDPLSVGWAPFQFEPGAFRRMIVPSLLLAVLVDAAVVLVAARWFVTASIGCGVCVAILGWRAASKALAGEERAVVSNSRQATIAAMAFVFTVIALLPYLRVAPLRGGFAGLLKTKSAPRNAATTPKDQTAGASDGYSGIILLPPDEQKKKIIVPIKREFMSFGGRLVQPLEIPFDGVYWYFKPPDKQPPPTARVVRGSSVKAKIRSSDRYPLLMEAHQRLENPIDLGCCSAMELVVENADRREGAIALELWVKRRAAEKLETNPKGTAVAIVPAAHYLGTVAIASSEQPLSARPGPAHPPEERLKFPVPAAMDGILFDEITVVVRPAPERMRLGAQIAIRKFVLEP